MSETKRGPLRQAIETQARELGFDLVGVTTPDPPKNYSVFENWLASGRHGEMDYLASSRSRERRANPKLILPECRSILVLGVPYHPSGIISPVPDQNDKTLVGKIASYAWGEDYHEILPTRLSHLTASIESLVGKPVHHRWYTDTGPILERELAQRAGLGWIGKNTCLIHPTKGSFFFLAEILLDLDLEPDTPFGFDRCGNCTRCLDACPTACILPDRTIDARRCISYLTIEFKGSIPEGLRPKIGEWIFGCDICQQVCPWNQRFSVQAGDPMFKTRLGMAQPDLLHEIALSSSEFNQRSRGSPLRRSKRRGYLRNVAVALGCARQSVAVNVLRKAVRDSESLVRMHSAWALGQIGNEDSKQALESALILETDPDVIKEIKDALHWTLSSDGIQKQVLAR